MKSSLEIERENAHKIGLEKGKLQVELREAQESLQAL